MILGITGHRPHKLGGYNPISNRSAWIKFEMEKFFKQKNVERINTGMALGIDQCAAEVALNVGIKITALIPCKDQERLWPEESRLRYQQLLEKIALNGEVVYVSLEPYSEGCMHRRNKEIVERSTEMLAVWDGTRGGTRDCVRLALNSSLRVTVLDPNTFEFRLLEKI